MDELIAEVPRKFAQFLVRLLQEFFQQAQLVHQFQRGWMDGIAAKIAKEVLVFFQYQHIDASPGQKKSEHDSSRTAADNAAVGAFGLNARLDFRLFNQK